MNEPSTEALAYVPPDPTLIDCDPVALDFWSRTLGVDVTRLRQAVARVGPVLETVKQDLGIGGAD